MVSFQIHRERQREREKREREKRVREKRERERDDVVKIERWSRLHDKIKKEAEVKSDQY